MNTFISLCSGISIFSVLLICLSTMNGIETANATIVGNTTSIVKIGDTNITALLAKTPEEQSKGLAIKDSLKENEGMLFVFDTAKPYSFWMKDMKFPIDIIWLDPNKKIVHIEHNLDPCAFLLPCPSYTPNSDSMYVLEVVSNFTNKHNIKIGDQIFFDKIVK